jgi:hypothetical protein
LAQEQAGAEHVGGRIGQAKQLVKGVFERRTATPGQALQMIGGVVGGDRTVVREIDGAPGDGSRHTGRKRGPRRGGRHRAVIEVDEPARGACTTTGP